MGGEVACHPAKVAELKTACLQIKEKRLKIGKINFMFIAPVNLNVKSNYS
jgi:hypothetical protein